MGQKHNIKRRDAVATRAAILVAARKRFLSESYDSVTLREIAGEAGVDVALISRYFGGKAALFREVLVPAGENPFDVTMNAKLLPRFLSQLVAGDGVKPPNHRMEMFIIMLRSASSSIASEIIRDHMRCDVLQPLISVIETDAAEWRANMLLALLMGVGVLRTVMESEGFACEAQNGDAYDQRLEMMFKAILEI